MTRTKPIVFEVFHDPSYYDMWAVRPKGLRDFNRTLHFSSKREAEHAALVINSWIGGV